MKRTLTLAVLVSSVAIAVNSGCSPTQTQPGTSAPVEDPSSAGTAEVPTAVSADIPYGQSTLFAVLDAGEDDHWLAPTDPATGRPVTGYSAIPIGEIYSHDITPDRATLIVVSDPAGTSSFPRLRFIDLMTWTEGTGLELPTRGWKAASAFSADGARYAFSTVDNRDRRIWLVDVAKHVVIESVETPLYVTALDFTSDGKALMIYGNAEDFNTGTTSGPPVAELRSAQDLDLIWSHDLDAVVDGFLPNANYKGEVHEPGTGSTYRPAVVFDAEGATMYVVHADADRLTRVEFERQRVLTQDIRPRMTLIERLLALGARPAHAKVMDGVDREAIISPDGTTIFMAGLHNKLTQLSDGEWQFEQIPLQLQAVDAASAEEIFRSEVAGQFLQYSAELDAIYVSFMDATGGAPSSYEVSAVDGAVLSETQRLELKLTHRMDGTPLLVSAWYGESGRGQFTANTLDGVPLGEWQVPRFGNWLLMP